MKLTFLAFFLIALLPGFSQEGNDELITDRPDQTESAVTVGAGRLQIETGFLYQYDKNNGLTQEDFVYNSSLLRLGLLNNMELRLGFELGDKRVKNTNNEQSITDNFWAPVTLGLKTEITEQKGLLPEMAILTTFILNDLGDESFSGMYTGFDFRLAAAHQISDNFGLGYNFGTEWSGGAPAPIYFYSVAAGFSLTPSLGYFIEPYGYISPTGPPEHMLDSGVTLLILNNLQFDLGGGIGLSEAAPDYFIITGLSWKP